MAADFTVHQAVQTWYPRWQRNAGDAGALRGLAQVLDSLRFDYGYNYSESREAFNRALAKLDQPIEVSPEDWEALQQDIEEAE